MDSKQPSIFYSQTGSALVIVLLVLVALTAIGLAAMRTSSVDMDIAASDKCSKETWWATDGGNQMTTELLERNIEDRGQGPDWTSGSYGPTGQVAVFTPDFYLNEKDMNICLNNVPSKTNRDVKVPNDTGGLSANNYGDTEVYIRVYGATGYSPGAALDQTSGYDGRAKSAAGGGAQIIYNIRGFGDGAGSCEARILQVWRHLI
jgi:PilX N-terminal